MVNRIFHIAINSTDLDRSVAFYRRLGFRVVSDQAFHNERLPAAFLVPTSDLRFVHLRLGDDPSATVLDIVQWGGEEGTKDRGGAAPPQHQQGITRFAVLTDDTGRVYRELSAAGVKFATQPTMVMTANGGWKVALAVDPDGVVVQITELVPAGDA